MKFRLKNKNNIRIDMRFLSRIQDCSIDKIKSMKINHGNKVKKVKDLFFVTGNDINYIEIISLDRFLCPFNRFWHIPIVHQKYKLVF